MKTTVYKSYGALAHEKHPVFSVFAPASDIFDKVEISIPDSLVAGKNETGDVLLKLDGMTYTLTECLTNAGDVPVIRWYNGQTWKTVNV